MKTSPRSIETLSAYKLKPFIFPPDMVVLMDTREQQSPLLSRYPKGLTICCTTLAVGDYSLQGFTDKIAIERKRISDLITYCTSEREKTKVKMERLSCLRWAGLMVEARESDLYRPYLFSSVSPELIRQCLVSFSIRYGVHIYTGNQEQCTRWMLDRLIKFWKCVHEL